MYELTFFTIIISLIICWNNAARLNNLKFIIYEQSTNFNQTLSIAQGFFKIDS